jgi:hypothetical protein
MHSKTMAVVVALVLTAVLVPATAAPGFGWAACPQPQAAKCHAASICRCQAEGPPCRRSWDHRHQRRSGTGYYAVSRPAAAFLNDKNHTLIGRREHSSGGRSRGRTAMRRAGRPRTGAAIRDRDAGAGQVLVSGEE